MFIRLVAFRYVAGDAENADQPAGLIAHRRLDRLEQAAIAVRGEGQPLLVGARFAELDRLAIVLAEGVGKILVEEIIVRLADEIPFGDAGEALELGIATQVDAIDVLQPDEVGNGPHQGAQSSFMDAQLAICGQAGQAVGQALADRLEQSPFILAPLPWARTLMHAEHVRFASLWVNGRTKHGLNAERRHQPVGRRLFGLRIEDTGQPEARTVLATLTSSGLAGNSIP